jgi:hypothetical protein
VDPAAHGWLTVSLLFAALAVIAGILAITLRARQAELAQRQAVAQTFLASGPTPGNLRICAVTRLSFRLTWAGCTE